MNMKKDNAVSPVIGSILLVAITVIIAAVIAAFVFGMTGDIQQTRIVAITSDISQNAATGQKHIVLTNHGGKDMATLVNLTAMFNGSSCATWVSPTNLNSLKTVGGSAACNVGAVGGRTHVVVTGSFADGSAQVLLDTYQ